MSEYSTELGQVQGKLDVLIDTVVRLDEKVDTLSTNQQSLIMSDEEIRRRLAEAEQITGKVKSWEGIGTGVAIVLGFIGTIAIFFKDYLFKWWDST